MPGKCKKEGCYDDIKCSLGEPFKKDCPYYVGSESKESGNDELVTERETHLLSWSGNSLGIDDLKIVAERTSPLLISLIGAENSGKTTLLGLLYLLLNNGRRLASYRFSNSYTLIGWEYIANYLRYEAGSKPSFPPHTSSYGGRDIGLVHLGLKNSHRLKDVLFTDVPGEWFKHWSVDSNDPNAGQANWIDEHATGVILFLDSEGLSSNESGTFRASTLKLIRRLANNIGKRKVAVLWSKADLRSGINPSITKIISREIENKLENHKIFDVSIQHGTKGKYHNNILHAIEWLIEEDVNELLEEMELDSLNSEDYLFRFR